MEPIINHSTIAARIQEDSFGYRGFRESSDQNRSRSPGRGADGVSRLVADVVVAVLRADFLHPADPAADVRGDPGQAQPGEPADEEPMAPPVDARVDDRVEPERQAARGP